MKKYLVIGNPIEHSLSPQLHNHWIKINNINAVYEKRKINENEIEELIRDLKNEKISGINVTVPFKQKVIPHLDELTNQAKKTNSVNTIYLGANSTIGHNTDAEGFEESLKYADYDVKDKDILILGAGGVVPSINFALINLQARSIVISNRTRENAENLKKLTCFLNTIFGNNTKILLNANEAVRLSAHAWRKKFRICLVAPTF